MPLANASLPEDPSEAPELSEIIRAIQYAREELLAHLEVGTADSDGKTLIIKNLAALVQVISSGRANSELSQHIDDLLETIGEFERAYHDLIAGAKAQAAEFAQELEAKASGLGVVTLSIPSGLDELALIDKEIVRRQAEDERVREFLDETIMPLAAENQRKHTELKTRLELEPENAAELGPKIRHLNDVIRGGENTKSDIIAGLEDNNNKILILQERRRALALVSEALPPGIIDEKLEIIAHPKK